MDNNRENKNRDGSNNNEAIKKRRNFNNSSARPQNQKFPDRNMEHKGFPERKNNYSGQGKNFKCGKNSSFDEREKNQKNRFDNVSKNSREMFSFNGKNSVKGKDRTDFRNRNNFSGNKNNAADYKGINNKRGGHFDSGDGKRHGEFDNIRIGGGYTKSSGDENYLDKISVEETYVEDTGLTESERNEELSEGVVAGRNAVRELLRSERSVDKIYVSQGRREGSIIVIVAEAAARHIPIVEVSEAKLDALSGGIVHQGVVAYAASKQYCSIDDIIKKAHDLGEVPFIVIADGIEDPHNLGALIRCAECAGVHGIIIPKRRAVGITPVVTKSSAGAIEHMLIAKVQNIASAVDALKKEGVWIYAADASGDPYYTLDYSGGAAFVFGSEGDGVSRLIMDKSDFHVSIPMYGQVNSLNVSTAASVVLCHAARVRHGL